MDIKQAGAELSQAQPSWARKALNSAGQLPLYRVKLKQNLGFSKKSLV